MMDMVVMMALMMGLSIECGRATQTPLVGFLGY
jgi:hypothetical protein